MTGSLHVIATMLLAAARGTVPPVDFASLLAEMVDRAASARLPVPWYECSQHSSYDRRSTSPDDPDGWWANADAGHFVRIDTVGERREWVLADVAGPGAVVRIWSANPKGTLRVYLDGADRPVIESPMADLLGGRAIVPLPLAAERSRGWNLYLPIPFAERCRITSDSGDFYYQVNVRTYEPGAVVRSLTRADLADDAGLIRRTVQALQDPAVTGADRDRGSTQRSAGGMRLEPGKRVTVALPPGPAAVRLFEMHLEASPRIAESLRRTVVSMAFDGEQTVWCPVGDFFGTGVGLNRYRGWWREVRDGGTLVCRWVMPYERSAEIALENLGEAAIDAWLSVTTGPWSWDERSIHFHATWRQEHPIPTRPQRDWNYVAVDGTGVYMGDALAVVNPVKNWWGEGDEKIYVDGEDFPSHFGTGTEDYYGYAWCCPDVFAAPFHAQPRCDGPDNYGHTTVTRTRALDAIPFRRSLRFDMEVWHQVETSVGFAATTYFYARPGATTNRGEEPEEAGRGVIDPPPLPPPYRIDGAIECEALPIADRSPGLEAGPQGGFGPDLWSGDQQLWVRGREPGDFVMLRVPAPDDRPRRVLLHATRSWDYGIVRLHVNGRRAGDDVDLFNTAGRFVAVTGPLDLGVHEPLDGRFLLRIEVVGGHPESLGTKSFFGLDCVVLGEPGS